MRAKVTLEDVGKLVGVSGVTVSNVINRRGGTSAATQAKVWAAVEATGYVDLCPIGTVAGEVASSNDGIRGACLDVFDGWQRVITAELTRAGLDADLTAELSATAVAALLGGFVLVRTSRSGEPLRAAGRQLRALVDGRLAATTDEDPAP